MLLIKSRLIVCLLIENKNVVKTINFSNPTYVGDPINSVSIFNQKKVDELVVLDIGLSKNNGIPDLSFLRNLAVEARMPLAYGGGVKDADMAIDLIGSGFEKIIIGNALHFDLSIISKISQKTGSQSIAAILDYYKCKNENIFKIKTPDTYPDICNIKEFVLKLKHYGIGEIIFQSIDRDGTLQGYDSDILEGIYSELKIPVTILGGASSLDELKLISKKFPLIGMGVGSLFIYKGKFKAVLLNYPEDTHIIL